MSNEERYDRAAQLAAFIVNCLGTDACTTVRFGKILYLVLEEIHAAEKRGFERGSGIHYN